LVGTKKYTWNRSILLVIIGLIGLFVGGQLIVENAVTLATIAGLSEALIGLTVVAIGTSLPELVTSVVAVLHKQEGIAIGNVIGSNVFNILWVLGITSIIQPLPISAALRFDMLIMLAVTALLLAFILLSRTYLLRRWHGYTFLLLFCIYLGYIAYRG
jgi:cation:H+ antiporter